MSRKKVRCVIESCDTVAFYKEAQLCERCYSRLYYATQKGVSWMLSRARKLDNWAAGLEYLLGSHKVTQIKPKRRQRQRRAA